MNLTRRSVLGSAAAAAAVSLVPVAAEAKRPQTLRVLAFNIWMGGSIVPNGLQLVAQVIRDQQADVVLLSESGDKTAVLAGLLNADGCDEWSHVDSADTGILTRYPLVGEGHLKSTTKAVIDVEGRQVACYASHMEYRWYATYLPRGYGGGSASGPFQQYGWDEIPTGPVDDVNAVLADNALSGRPDVARAIVADAAKEKRRGRSVIIGGDFNEPSVLDWTEATKNLYDHNGLVVPWQTTSVLRDAGYVDAYRSIFPDPVSHPGMTWPADNPAVGVDQLAWAPKADERDRIDYVFSSAMPCLKLLDAGIVGPAGSIIRSERRPDGTDDIIANPTPWASDHKAVLATYRLSGPKAKKQH